MELIQKIKKGLSGFNLAIQDKMSIPCYAEDVLTPTGTVDFIRFEDCKTDIKTSCKLVHYNEFPEAVQKAVSLCFAPGQCKKEKHTFPNDNCKYCVFRHDEYNVGILITCYEIKTSLKDFKNKQKHNFYGHHNYYVVPEELVNEIQDLIPEDIGIIVYYEYSHSYRIIKECTKRVLPVETELSLMYNAFKKRTIKL